MAKETKNLKLHQVTRPEDDSKAFNLETMLNENWEKLDSAVGDLSQQVTTAEGSAIGLRVQNGRLQYKNNESWTELGLEYEDVQNLAATPAGVITWALPQSTDNTRTAIVLCRATKDISNMDYSACLADATITKTTLAQNATSNTYTGLTNNTQYWVKAFVKYALGGKEFYSGGVTVTFTYDKPVVITEFYNKGNEFTAVTGGWVEGYKYGPTSFKLSEYMDLSAGINNDVSSQLSVVTNNAIDLTNINTLCIEWEITFGTSAVDYNAIAFGSSKEKNTGIIGGNARIAFDGSSGNFTKKISKMDVSHLTGLNYIRAVIWVRNLLEAFVNPLRVFRVWGES